MGGVGIGWVLDCVCVGREQGGVGWPYVPAEHAVPALPSVQDSMIEGEIITHGGARLPLLIHRHACCACSALPVVPAVPAVQDSMIEGNIVTDRGAGYAIESADIAAFFNTTIKNNVAAMKGGGGWSASEIPVQLIFSAVHNNTAAMGGGAFVLAPGK